MTEDVGTSLNLSAEWMCVCMVQGPQGWLVPGLEVTGHSTGLYMAGPPSSAIVRLDQ